MYYQNVSEMECAILYPGPVMFAPPDKKRLLVIHEVIPCDAVGVV